MIALDEEALICDFAETYHIFDFRGLPLKLAATLAVGLSDNSRIKTRLSGAKASPDVLMMAAIIDNLKVLVWSKTEDARKNRNRPKSILSGLFEKPKTVDSFVSGKDFEEARQKIKNKIKGGACQPN